MKEKNIKLKKAEKTAADREKKNDKKYVNEFPLLADKYEKDDKAAALAFNEEYKNFLDMAKTEREAVKITVEAAEELGFRALDDVSELKPGMKVYKDIRSKGLILAVIGEEDISDGGFRILGAHIDSPRLDMKPLPVVEDHELVYFRTHYYGGIKKYQWASIPLSLHGVASNKKGEQVEINIGEKAEDPKFIISDLLPHLGKSQMEKKAADIISGENLSLLVGSLPLEGEDEDSKSRFKDAVLKYFYDEYGIRERDLISSEICAVPAVKAEDIGFDRMLTASYGQDDRVCAYPAIKAVFDIEKPKYTAVALLTDKEEIGSTGNTGAHSRSYEMVLMEIFAKIKGSYDELGFRKAMRNSAMLSADVTNAFDPLFASVSDLTNTNFLGHGISLQKYTGSRGKSGASDANSEFMSGVVRLFDEHSVLWQTGEMGKVDEGGGGTIALYFAALGMQVLDCGVPVLSMHSPYEISNKFDVYETYRGYKVFALHYCE